MADLQPNLACACMPGTYSEIGFVVSFHSWWMGRHPTDVVRKQLKSHFHTQYVPFHVNFFDQDTLTVSEEFTSQFFSSPATLRLACRSWQEVRACAWCCLLTGRDVTTAPEATCDNRFFFLFASFLKKICILPLCYYCPMKSLEPMCCVFCFFWTEGVFAANVSLVVWTRGGNSLPLTATVAQNR